MATDEKIDTMNRWGIAARAAGDRDELFMLLPPRGALSKDDALLLAAWLVALVEYDEDCPRFRAVLAAVLST